MSKYSELVKEHSSMLEGKGTAWAALNPEYMRGCNFKTVSIPVGHCPLHGRYPAQGYGRL